MHQETAEATPMIQGFRDLVVWQKSMALTERVYTISAQFPREETYGLMSQMRRAAVSIPSNVAEGKGVAGQGFARHLRIALGSEAELQTQIELACRLQMIAPAEAKELMNAASEVGKMLRGLVKSLPTD
jgi:four helix bundle protein